MNKKDSTPAAWIEDLLRENLSGAAWQWYESSRRKIGQGGQDRDLYMAFSAVPRYTGKAALQYTPRQAAEAHERWGLRLYHFRLDQLARIALLLHMPEAGRNEFQRRIQTLFNTADMGEQVALFKGFPLYPYPETLLGMAAEGVRTNMVDVFDAIALDNPYPAAHLKEGAWNQLVLKSAFIDRPIIRILGLEERRNADLDRIISDYAHERWAAGRTITPEIWRAVSYPLADFLVEDMRNLIAGSPYDRQAAALVLAAQPEALPGADLAAERARVQAGSLSWETLSEDWWKQKT